MRRIVRTDVRCGREEWRKTDLYQNVIQDGSFSETDFIGLNSTRYDKQKERKNNSDEQNTQRRRIAERNAKNQIGFFFLLFAICIPSVFAVLRIITVIVITGYQQQNDKTIIFLERVAFKHVPDETNVYRRNDD